MWGIFIGSLLFVLGGTAMLSPSGFYSLLARWPSLSDTNFVALLPSSGFSPIPVLICTAGMTLALVSTARYAANLMAASVPVKLSAKRTIYDDIGTETSLAESNAPR